MTQVDPRWREFSASRRGRYLYVKMPQSKARAICLVSEVLGARHPEDVQPLTPIIRHVKEELSAADEYRMASVFLRLTITQVKEDIERLRSLEGFDATGTLVAYRECLEKGLNRDPDIDWIARVDGPTGNTSPVPAPLNHTHDAIIPEMGEDDFLF